MRYSIQLVVAGLGHGRPGSTPGRRRGRGGRARGGAGGRRAAAGAAGGRAGESQGDGGAETERCWTKREDGWDIAWENHGYCMGRLWEDDEKMMGIWWEITWKNDRKVREYMGI